MESKGQDVVAALGICCGLAFGLYSLLHRGDLIGTEIISYELARNGPAFLLERLTYDCESPGTARYHVGLLYHLLLGVWLHLGSSELVIRAFTALCGLASLALLGWLARPLGRSPALALVALCATSPMLVNWFTSARAYGLFFLLSVASCGCVLALSRTKRVSRALRWAGLYLFTVAALLYTHHFAMHLLAAHAVFAVAFVVADRRRIGRLLLMGGGMALGVLAAAPLWPILQLHRLSRDLVGRPVSARMFLEGWFHHTGEFFVRIFRQFDHVNLVEHDGPEIAYVLVVLALTAVGSVVVWRRSRVLAGFLVVVFVVPIVLQATVIAATGHSVRGLRYYIYLVPVLHLPWVLLVEHLSNRGSRFHHPALPAAVLTLGIGLNIVGCVYAMSTLTWSRNHAVADIGDVIPDLQPWRMQTDWRGLADHLQEQEPESRIVVTSSIKEALYLRYYLPDEAEVVNLGKGSRRPRGASEPPRHALDGPLACLDRPLAQISLGPPPGGKPGEIGPGVAFRRSQQGVFGILHLVRWEPLGRPATCAGGPNLTMLDARVGDRDSLILWSTASHETTLTLLARMADEPPFSASVRVQLDGRPPEYRPIGVTAALVHSFDFDLLPGNHEVHVEVVPMQEADPGACWSMKP